MKKEPDQRPAFGATAITLSDGRILRTLGDASELITDLNETIQRHPWVEYAGELIMAAQASGAERDIKSATTQIGVALRQEGMIRLRRRVS